MKTLLTLLIVLGFIVKALGQIPQYIIVKADSILMEKAGNNYFNSIRLNCKESGPWIANSVWGICESQTVKINKKQKAFIKKIRQRNSTEYYYLKYDFSLESNYNYAFMIRLDTFGQLYKSHDIKLPDCNKFPDLCFGLIKKEKAIEIAESINFDKGLKKWDIELVFNERTRRFCWEIKNYKQHNLLSYQCIDSSGELLIIDCQNGKIEEVLEWRKTCVI